MLLLLLAASLIPGGGAADAPYGCKDNNGDPVDWFFAYKLPNGSTPQGNPLIGSSFQYLDAKVTNWTAVPQQMDNQRQAVGYTMKQYYVAKGKHLNPSTGKRQRKVIGNKGHNAPAFSQETLTSYDGVEFVNFAKNAAWNKDLYYDGVTSQLKIPLFVRTWRPNLPSWCEGGNCTKECIYNIKSNITFSNRVFQAGLDHSKFAVSMDPSKPYVCVGDINRNTAQYKRGGGLTCLSNRAVWNAYNGIIGNVQPDSSSCESPDGSICSCCGSVLDNANRGNFAIVEKHQTGEVEATKMTTKL